MQRIIIIDHFKQRLDLDFFSDLSDYEIVTAYSNEDALKIHRAKNADLIITELYGSGMNTVQFCYLLREDAGVRAVSVIVFCRDNEIELRECGRCRANAVMTLPVVKTRLQEKMHQLLSVPPRRSFRTDFSARRVGTAAATIGCRTENISVTGMLIEASATLQAGEKLSCNLALLPASPIFTAQAEVVRADTAQTGRYGIKFTSLDPAARKAIERIVRPTLSAA